MNERLPLRVMAVEHLHLMVGARSLCGQVRANERDVYADPVALAAWNEGPLNRCGRCETALELRAVRRSREAVQA